MPFSSSPMQEVTQDFGEPYSIFDQRQKALIVFLVSFAATFSSFASNIYFPSLPTIAEDLSVSIELVNLTVTSYLIFQGLAPSFWGPVSDVRGRRIAYIGTFLVFLGACIGLAQTKSYIALVILRCLQSTGSASTIAIGSGVIGDITTRAERGGYMGVFQGGLLVPVAAGPVIGGALAGFLGWRAIFWFLTIYSAIFLALLVLLLPETLRHIVGNGGLVPSTFVLRFPLDLYQKFSTLNTQSVPSGLSNANKAVIITGPIRILFSKQAAPITIFLALYYSVWQMTITAMSALFANRYHLNETQIGLTFIANGAGSIAGTLITGKILDIDFRKVTLDCAAKSNIQADEAVINVDRPISMDDGFPLEKARLHLIPFFSTIQCLSAILFGWTIEYSSHVHIALPVISTFITGWTAVSTQSIVMTYLVDMFIETSAAASASLNLARCMFAAVGTSVVMPMVNKVGVGWAFTICALVQLTALSGAFFQYRFGKQWRNEVGEQTVSKHRQAIKKSSLNSQHVN